ncbi:MAG: hypothetical protein HOV84_19730 [Streptomyces sp.]|nr:hypothetical protein [Streptomyces sp.]
MPVCRIIAPSLADRLTARPAAPGLSPTGPVTAGPAIPAPAPSPTGPLTARSATRVPDPCRAVSQPSATSSA